MFALLFAALFVVTCLAFDYATHASALSTTSRKEVRGLSEGKPLPAHPVFDIEVTR